jgi:hypothetical protein
VFTRARTHSRDQHPYFKRFEYTRPDSKAGASWTCAAYSNFSRRDGVHGVRAFPSGGVRVFAERKPGRIVECMGYARSYSSGAVTIVVDEDCVPEATAEIRVESESAPLQGFLRWQYAGKKTFIYITPK